MRWHEKILKEKGKELFSSSASLLAFALALSLWRFAFGKSFEWQNIEPIDLPTIPVRAFYSALTFGTSGALLYFSGFYKKLHDVVVKEFGAWKLYKGIKKVIWLALMGFTYWVLPKIVHVLNAIISFIYNILTLTLYLSPALGVATIVFFVCWLALKGHDEEVSVIVSVESDPVPDRVEVPNLKDL